MSSPDILCVGHVNWDVVLHTGSIPDPDFSASITTDHASSGGSATNTALAFASFDEDVAMLGGIGDDEFGTRVEDALVDGGVDPHLVRTDVPTTRIYAIITDDADPRYFDKNANVGEFGVDDIDSSVWDAVNHIHVTSFDEAIAAEVAQQAKADGKTVSFNPSQGYEGREFPAVVEAADVIFLNERENNIFRSRYNFPEVASETCIVITHGSVGSSVYSPNGVANHPGFNVDAIEDTIGAGDAFTAGFLTAWLDDKPNREALAMGNAAGAYAIQHVGGVDDIDADWVRETARD